MYAFLVAITTEATAQQVADELTSYLDSLPWSYQLLPMATLPDDMTITDVDVKTVVDTEDV